MPKIVDQQTDRSQAVLVAAMADLKFSKLAELLTDTAPEEYSLTKVASHQFAWPEARMFPVGSQDSVVRSQLYFNHQRAQIPADVVTKIAATLDTYLDLHSVPQSVFECKEPEAAIVKEGSYLVPSLGLCKVASVQDLNNAEALFEREHLNLNLRERVEFAQNFVKQASALGAPLTSGVIAKYAGVLDTCMHSVSEMLHVRSGASARAGKDGTQFLKLAESLKAFAGVPVPREELQKLADLIYTMDISVGLDAPKYDRHLPDAFKTVFCKTATAQDIEAEGPDLQHLDKAKIIARYGEDALEAVEDKDGEIDDAKLKQIIDREDPHEA